MSKRGVIGMVGVVILAFLISLWFYPRLPDPMASHWNAHGQVDGYMSRFWGAFLMPFVLVGLAFLFYVIPLIDPLRENIRQFRGYYEGFVFLFFLYMLAIHLWTLLWNVGIRISPNVFFPIGVGVLFVFVGFLLEHVRPNWFVGIRTPWTLSSERVWKRTHQVGAWVFKVIGVLVMVGGILAPRHTVWIILGTVIAGTLGLVVYSYVLYEQERRASGGSH